MKLMVIQNQRLRRLLSVLIPFVIIPAAVLIFAFGPLKKHYALASLLVTLLALVVFSCGCERRKTGTCG